MRHAREVYDLLGVLLTPDDTVGESFYNPLLPVVVEELSAKGLLVEDNGALCVFPEGFENRSGAPRDDRDRLLGPERGEGDARRPPAQHADR